MKLSGAHSLYNAPGGNRSVTLRPFRLSIRSPKLLWKLGGAFLLFVMLVGAFFVPLQSELAYRDFQSALNAKRIYEQARIQTDRIVPLMDGSSLNLVALDHLTVRLKYEMEDRHRGLSPSPYFGLSDFTPDALSLRILDAKANVLAQAGPYDGSADTGLNISRVINAALNNDQDESHLVYDGENGLRLAAVPISGEGRKVLGAFVVTLRLPAHWWQTASRNNQGGVRWIDLLLLGLFSVAFGFLVARRLAKRLNRISDAADAWSRGDFSAKANDPSADEIGALSRHLNQMAEALQEVVTLRQNLAASEERNRLARDLHDTVKQQAFALSLQIAAAQALLGRDDQAAQTRMAEAGRLAYQIQQELISLLQELRPAVPPGRGLAAVMRETIADWSRQNGIPVELRCENIPTLTAEAQEALLRILQESLANIARHSRATSVVVEVHNDNANGVKLSVKDNGYGFDPQTVAAGMGLHNMNERAASLPGGWFSLESHPGNGTCVEAGFLANSTR
jgi:signal transduction histidine kinase